MLFLKSYKIRQNISLLFLNIIIFQFIVHYIYAFHIVLVFLLMIMYVITRRDKCMFCWYVKVMSQASANLTTIQAWFLKSKNTLRIEITYSLVFRLDIYIRQFIFNIALGNISSYCQMIPKIMSNILCRNLCILRHANISLFQISTTLDHWFIGNFLRNQLTLVHCIMIFLEKVDDFYISCPSFFSFKNCT